MINQPQNQSLSSQPNPVNQPETPEIGQIKPQTPTDEFKSFNVNSKGFIELDGEVVETLPSITFKVRLENGYEILARLSGRMRMNKIMLLPGDRVKVEMSPYDLTKGRISYRY
jgi:translation initiation factor IF-1